MTGATNPDPELRSIGNANTPLGRSIFYARLYFENYVYPMDPRKNCRQNIIILVTDGEETCDTTAGNVHRPRHLRADRHLQRVSPGSHRLRGPALDGRPQQAQYRHPDVRALG